MKANELVIGDFIKLPDGASAKVISIAQDGIYFEDRQSEGVASFDNLLPIPLTQEILEKNGFVKYDMNSAEDYLDVPDLSPCFAYGYFPNGIENGWVINIINDNLVVSCRGCSIHKKIHYVHDLQHAIRFCEIEKEIVL